MRGLLPPFSSDMNTGRVLVAFLDKDNKPTWSAVLPLRDMTMRTSFSEAEIEMTFGAYSLET